MDHGCNSIARQLPRPAQGIRRRCFIISALSQRPFACLPYYLGMGRIHKPSNVRCCCCCCWSATRSTLPASPSLSCSTYLPSLLTQQDRCCHKYPWVSCPVGKHAGPSELQACVFARVLLLSGRSQPAQPALIKPSFIPPSPPPPSPAQPAILTSLLIFVPFI